MENANPGSQVYAFSGLLIDLARRTLERGERNVPLYARAFDALALLVSRPRELLTKAVLLDTLWPGVSVEENSVARVVSDLRKALGPAGAHIVTVPGLGYRLDADVTIAHARQHAEPSRRTLAILPFTALGVGDDERLLAFGLADTLVARLTHVRDVIVRPTNSVIRLAEAGASAIEVGRALNAEYVLSGSMRRAGGKLRVSVQLIDVGSEASVWASQLDEQDGDIFAVEDSISARVARVLAAELTSAEAELVTKRHTSDTAAYTLYQRGRYLLSRRSTHDATKRAIACFMAATERDTRFALAHAALAEAYVANSIAAHPLNVEPPQKMMPLAREAAERALALDAGLGEAHAILGHIACSFDWDWKAGLTRFRHAFRLNPHNATARQYYAICLSSQGEFEHALSELEIARALDPTSMWIRVNFGFILCMARRVTEAVEELEACAALEPGFGYARYRLGQVLEAAGRHADALIQYETLLSMPGAEVQALVGKAHALGVLGLRPEAEASLSRLRELAQSQYVSAYYFAEVYAGLGDVDAALGQLEDAYVERSVILMSLRNNPKFDGLRTDPRFRSLLDRMGI